MKILLVNDDGPDAVGLDVLLEGLSSMGDLTVVIPSKPVSGCAHAMTLNRPLRVRERGGIYVVDGYPVDCVKFALCELMDAPPALLFAGVNDGENVGISVLYSGTVAAAREGFLSGVPSVAVSARYGLLADGPREVVEIALGTVRTLVEGMGREAPFLLNVNIPSLHPRGVRVAPQDTGKFEEEVLWREDPRGGRYFWFDGEVPSEGTRTDLALFRQGYVTVTALGIDQTDHEGNTSLSDRLASLLSETVE